MIKKPWQHGIIDLYENRAVVQTALANQNVKDIIAMLDSILDEISIDELAQLRSELNDFFAAHDTYQWCYCEGDADADSADRSAALKAELLRDRIRGIAIDWGIHKEFLREFSESLAKNGLKIAA